MIKKFHIEVRKTETFEMNIYVDTDNKFFKEEILKEFHKNFWGKENDIANGPVRSYADEIVDVEDCISKEPFAEGVGLIKDLNEKKIMWHENYFEGEDWDYSCIEIPYSEAQKRIEDLEKRNHYRNKLKGTFKNDNDESYYGELRNASMRTIDEENMIYEPIFYTWIKNEIKGSKLGEFKYFEEDKGNN